MPEPQNLRTSRSSTGQPDKQAEPARLAAQIAIGLTPFPDDLPPLEAAELLERVREARRQRLVNLIAQAIAHDIKSGSGQPKN